MWLNYNETYAVSEDGYVMNRKTGLILKPNSDRYGYLRVSLHHKEITHIHRMVAQMFCPKIDLPDLVVDHINRDETDNDASNLRWVSKSINARNVSKSNIIVNKDGYRVRFCKNGKSLYDKHFTDLELATSARDKFRQSEEYRLSL